MTDANILGRLDALEFLLTELTFDSIVRGDAPITEHQFQGKMRQLILKRGEELREFGHAQDRIGAFVATMNRMASEIGDKLSERAVLAD